MQKQTHRSEKTRTPFQEKILSAFNTLRDRESPWRKKQAALKDLNTRIHVIWDGSQGPMVRQSPGAKGKAARKALRKASHTRGYYRQQREAAQG